MVWHWVYYTRTMLLNIQFLLGTPTSGRLGPTLTRGLEADPVNIVSPVSYTHLTLPTIYSV